MVRLVKNHAYEEGGLTCTLWMNTPEPRERKPIKPIMGGGTKAALAS